MTILSEGSILSSLIEREERKRERGRLFSLRERERVTILIERGILSSLIERDSHNCPHG